jgi:hypothetical protein
MRISLETYLAVNQPRNRPQPNLKTRKAVFFEISSHITHEELQEQCITHIPRLASAMG